jgi:hypothetical protein
MQSETGAIVPSASIAMTSMGQSFAGANAAGIERLMVRRQQQVRITAAVVMF